MNEPSHHEGMVNPWSDRPWRRVGVYGGGLSGRAAAALLRRHGVAVVLWDGREPSQVDLGPLATDPGVVAHFGGEPDAAAAAAIDALVVSPGVPLDRPLPAAMRAAGKRVIAEVELAFPFLGGTVIGITGSNGKSTTTAMTGAILAAAGRPTEVCGNIGVPLSALADGEPGRSFVVELSSFQLEAVDRLRCRAATLLNLSEDHLDRHGDLGGYRDAKARIFARQEGDDVAVLNLDDPFVRDLETPARRRFISRVRAVADGCHLEGETVVEVVPGKRPSPLFRRDDVQVPGPHNLENAMAAALLARAVGISAAEVAAGLRGFTGLPHRLQQVGERRGVVFYDDSKGTNVGATRASLEGFHDGTVHLILGGRNKGADLGQLRDIVARKAVAAYLIGEAADEMARGLGEAVPITACGTLEVAVERAAAAATAGEVVVLSPACASFDQFQSFVHRGRAFQALVAALPEEDGDGA